MISVCVIAIGDELLNGFTLDTNTQWVKEKLSKTEAVVVKSTIVPDNELLIVDELANSLMKEYDFIIISGGLGPTHDDITKKTLSDFLKLPLLYNQNYLEDLKKRFGYSSQSSTNDIKKRREMIFSQALILDKFTPIYNKLGTALGMLGKQNNSTIIVLPGVPKEFKQMFQDNIIPCYIPYSKVDPVVTLKTIGITESKLYIMLESIISRSEGKYKFSFLPHFSGVNIRISKLNNSSMNNEFILSLKNKLGIYYYGQNNDTLDSILSQLLIKKNIKISLAESCTGGLLSKKLTDLSGSSKYFIGSVIAYSNKIKNQFLNVPNEVLINEGAVSSKTALIMSDSIMKIFKTDIGVSITGISGPEGSSPEKPLGLYYISIKHRSDHFYKKFIFKIKDRSIHREVVSNTALNLIRLTLDKL